MGGRTGNPDALSCVSSCEFRRGGAHSEGRGSSATTTRAALTGVRAALVQEGWTSAAQATATGSSEKDLRQFCEDP